MKQHKRPIFTIIIILLLLIISCRKPTAPSDHDTGILWTKTFGGAGSDKAFSVQETSDRGYIIVGHTESFGVGGYDIYLIKADRNGDTVWTKTYGGVYGDFCRSVQQTSNREYIITGYKYSSEAGHSDVYLIKVNRNGDILWTRTYGGISSERGYSVQQTSDGGYIITGFTYSFGKGNSDVYLIKTDAQGDLLWTRTYGGSSTDWGFSVQQTSDGGYIITGFTYSFGKGNSDVYLIKTDAQGDLLWTRTYGGSSEDWGYSVQQTSDGGYITAGHTYSFGEAIPYYNNVYLIKTNYNGDTLWTRTYGGIYYDESRSVRETSDGGYIIAGWTDSFGEGGHDVYLLKTNKNGNLLWSKTYGGPNNDNGYSVQQTFDGGYIVVGHTYSFGAGNFDFYLIKTKP